MKFTRAQLILLIPWFGIAILFIFVGINDFIPIFTGFYLFFGIILLLLWVYTISKFIKSNKAYDEYLLLAKPYFQKLKKEVEDFKIKNNFNDKDCITVGNSEDFYDELWWVNGGNLISIRDDGSYENLVYDGDDEIYSNLVREKKNQFPLLERKIELNKIKYYKVDGQKRYETKIKGGGSSIGGALVGGAIAGDVGAIIGSRKKIESEEVEHDERKIVLVYEKKDKLINEKFVYSDYFDVFEKLIPEKNYELLLLQTSNKRERKTKR